MGVEGRFGLVKRYDQMTRRVSAREGDEGILRRPIDLTIEYITLATQKNGRFLENPAFATRRNKQGCYGKPAIPGLLCAPRYLHYRHDRDNNETRGRPQAVTSDRGRSANRKVTRLREAKWPALYQWTSSRDLRYSLRE